VAGEVFSQLDREARDTLLSELTDNQTRSVFNDLDPDDRNHLLSELPGKVVQQLLNCLPPDELQKTRTLLGYPEESVGRLMTPDRVMVRPDWTTGQALDHMRRCSSEFETVDVVYIVEKGGRLLDAVGLRRLVVVDEGDVLLGIVTFDDVLDVVEEEVTEDFHRMAPIGLMKKSLRDAGVADIAGGIICSSIATWYLGL